jgi:hypothetical protein
MTISKRFVKWFEGEQRTYGTAIALKNLLWLKAAADLKALGVRKLTTVYRRAR